MTQVAATLADENDFEPKSTCVIIVSDQIDTKTGRTRKVNSEQRAQQQVSFYPQANIRRRHTRTNA